MIHLLYTAQRKKSPYILYGQTTHCHQCPNLSACFFFIDYRKHNNLFLHHLGCRWKCPLNHYSRLCQACHWICSITFRGSWTYPVCSDFLPGPERSLILFRLAVANNSMTRPLQSVPSVSGEYCASDRFPLKKHQTWTKRLLNNGCFGKVRGIYALNPTLPYACYTSCERWPEYHLSK